MPFDPLCFIPIAEPKTVKNRIHLDVTTADVELCAFSDAEVSDR